MRHGVPCGWYRTGDSTALCSSTKRAGDESKGHFENDEEKFAFDGASAALGTNYCDTEFVGGDSSATNCPERRAMQHYDPFTADERATIDRELTSPIPETRTEAEFTAVEQAAIDAWPALWAQYVEGVIDRHMLVRCAMSAAAGWCTDTTPSDGELAAQKALS